MRKTKIIAIASPVEFEINAAPAEGEKKPAPKFTANFYNGGLLDIAGYELPVVVDLAGLTEGNVLVANLDHDQSKRVGNFNVNNDGKSLTAYGKATAVTAAAEEVVKSAENGYQWQASLEVMPQKIDEVKAGKTVTVNGQSFEGPLYVTRKGVLKGFAFVSHGADDTTTATIAAKANLSKEPKTMDAKCKEWIEAMGFNTDELSAEQLAGLEANYNGKHAATIAKQTAGNAFEKRKAERDRRKEIEACAERYMDMRPNEIEEIEKLVAHAITSGMSAQDFRCEMAESAMPAARAPFKSREEGLSGKHLGKVLEAAVCRFGQLQDFEKHFDERTLQLAEDTFPTIRLSQIFYACAKANGYDCGFGGVTLDIQAAACGHLPRNRMQMADGFSTITITDVTANVANKFLREGWNAIDMTPTRIAAVHPVNDFKTITTVSLTGDLQFEQVGSDGAIKHGTLSDLTYTGQASTYAKMLAITRQDIINDDLGALTSVPRRLGRGGALKLNDIFWTTFLNNSSFFTSGNNNVNTGVADTTVGGLDATETILVNQTDPDGKPLGISASVILTPPAHRNGFIAMMSSDQAVYATNTATYGTKNPFAGRYRVESSPYMANSSYTGYDVNAWYLLCDPAVMPVVEIQALNGRVEPTVESADANFNVLGIQMRGFSDIGVSMQEKRGGVRADGGSS